MIFLDIAWCAICLVLTWTSKPVCPSQVGLQVGLTTAPGKVGTKDSFRPHVPKYTHTPALLGDLFSSADGGSDSGASAPCTYRASTDDHSALLVSWAN